MRDWTKWMKAAGIRALKTFCQTAVAMLPASAVITEVGWEAVFGTAALAVRYGSVGGSCINADEPCWYSGRGDVKQTTATLSNGQIDDKKQPPHLSGGSLFEC